MKNLEIKKALQNELKDYDEYTIFIRWFEDCDNSSYVEICSLLDENENEWGDVYYPDNLSDLKGLDDLTTEEIKNIKKDMKKVYNYLKKHFDNVILEDELQWI